MTDVKLACLWDSKVAVTMLMLIDKTSDTRLPARLLQNGHHFQFL